MRMSNGLHLRGIRILASSRLCRMLISLRSWVSRLRFIVRVLDGSILDWTIVLLCWLSVMVGPLMVGR